MTLGFMIVVLIGLLMLGVVLYVIKALPMLTPLYKVIASAVMALLFLIWLLTEVQRRIP